VGIVNVATIFTSNVGLFMLVTDKHYGFSLCAPLSIAYWGSALWIGWMLSPYVSGVLFVVAVVMRRSWLLFPSISISVTYTKDSEAVPKNFQVESVDSFSTHHNTIAKSMGCFGCMIELNWTVDGTTFTTLDDTKFKDKTEYTLTVLRPGKIVRRSACWSLIDSLVYPATPCLRPFAQTVHSPDCSLASCARSHRGGSNVPRCVFSPSICVAPRRIPLI
jgi:hypothetical protein